MLHAILEYRVDLLLFAALAVGGMVGVHLWLRRGRGAPGVRPAAWVALAALLLGGALVAEHNGDRARRRLRDTLQGFAPTYAEVLQRMGHARLSWDVGADDPAYLAMIQAQKRWLAVNPLVADIYTYRHTPDGKVAFLVDSETDYNRDGRYEGEREGRTPVGEVYEEADETMAAALAGTPAFDGIPFTDRWGTWVSAYVPLFDDAGRIEGALGVDYDAASWSMLILSQRGVVLGAAALLVVILLASTATNTALRAEVDRRTTAERALAASEERSRLIIDSALDAVVTVDGEGRITGWNARAEAIFGWPAAEALGRSLAQLILPERHRADHRRRLAEFAAAGAGFNSRVELHGVRRGGEEFPIELSVTRLQHASRVDTFAGFIRDITERQAAERALRRSEERFRVAAQCASDSIYEWDLNSGHLEWFGDGAQQAATNLSTIDAWEKSIHPDDRGRVQAALRRHVDDNQPFREEYRVVAADGTVRHWVDRGALLRDGDGRARMMVGAMTEVTREKRAQALEAEKAALKRAVSSMEQVLGVVAHELRTPLAGVRAISEFLLDAAERDGDEFNRYLRGMNHEVVRMAETVNNLLEAARINSGRARWNWSAFDVAGACRDAIDRARPLVDAAAVALSCDVTPQVLEMAGDADAVSRLVLNLLSNAVKHTRAGAIAVVARQSDAGDGRWVELVVSDTGDGIPPDILDRLGEAFALNAGIVGAKHVKGTGLGLAICGGIAAAHGGRIHFESAVGRGTRVTVRLRADLPGPAGGNSSTTYATVDEGGAADETGLSGREAAAA
jgi:PAS domain S-box-containing protein